MDEKSGAAAAVAAITAKAKLAGLWREKVAQTDPSGENAPRYIISDHVMSEENWRSLSPLGPREEVQLIPPPQVHASRSGQAPQRAVRQAGGGACRRQW